MDPINLAAGSIVAAITRSLSRNNSAFAEKQLDLDKRDLDHIRDLLAEDASATGQPGKDALPTDSELQAILLPLKDSKAEDLPQGETSAALSVLLEGFYKKVGRRADVSFFAALFAAVIGFSIIATGVLIGFQRSDKLPLSIITTAVGVFTQALSIMFFRNRTEERKMMLGVLGDLRKDADADVKMTRAFELTEQVVDPALRDSLVVAIALELSDAGPDLERVHALTRSRTRPRKKLSTQPPIPQGDQNPPE